jgi:hypothetical protein
VARGRLSERLGGGVEAALTLVSAPALPLARLRGRGELVELRAADLRFTPEEAAESLTEVMGLAGTPGLGSPAPARFTPHRPISLQASLWGSGVFLPLGSAAERTLKYR